MTALIDALRSRYRTPQAALRALGLDEALLREGKPMKQDEAKQKAAKAGLQSLIAQDASLEQIMEFIDAVSGANKANAAKSAPPDEYEDDEPEAEEGETENEEEEMEPNAGLPEGFEKKAEDEDADGMADVGSDNEGGGDDRMAKVHACLKTLMELLGAGGGEEKPAIDEEPKPEDKEMVKKEDLKTAMDAAIAGERKRQHDIRDAEDAVRPFVGKLIACDSADDVYRHGLKALGADKVDAIKDSAALRALWDAYPKPGASAPRKLAMDADASKNYAERFPNANRLKRA